MPPPRPSPGNLARVIEELFHIATQADWDAAKKSGAYTTSTRGRTLAEEGFIHAASREQVMGVYQRYYADAGEPLVLLVIDPRKVEADIKLEKVGAERYPHVYGPIPAAAVRSVLPMTGEPSRASDFSRAFVTEMLTRVGLALLAMLGAFAGWAVLRHQGEWGGFVGALVGLALGIPVALATSRWLARRGR